MNALQNAAEQLKDAAEKTARHATALYAATRDTGVVPLDTLSAVANGAYETLDKVQVLRLTMSP